MTQPWFPLLFLWANSDLVIPCSSMQSPGSSCRPAARPCRHDLAVSLCFCILRIGNRSCPEFNLSGCKGWNQIAKSLPSIPAQASPLWLLLFFHLCPHGMKGQGTACPRILRKIVSSDRTAKILPHYMVQIFHCLYSFLTSICITTLFVFLFNIKVVMSFPSA